MQAAQEQPDRLEARIWAFTAVQAAQKTSSTELWALKAFTAVQAAQKLGTILFAESTWFTAV